MFSCVVRIGSLAVSCPEVWARMYRHIIILQPVDGATVVAMGHRCSNRSQHFLSLSTGRWCHRYGNGPSLFLRKKIQPVDGATVVAMGHRCSNRSHHFLSLSIGFFTSVLRIGRHFYVFCPECRYYFGYVGSRL